MLPARPRAVRGRPRTPRPKWPNSPASVVLGLSQRALAGRAHPRTVCALHLALLIGCRMRCLAVWLGENERKRERESKGENDKERRKKTNIYYETPIVDDCFYT